MRICSDLVIQVGVKEFSKRRSISFCPKMMVLIYVRGFDSHVVIEWSATLARKGFLPGTIISAYSLPYRIVLDNGTGCSAPSDSDQLIRAAKVGDEGTPEGIKLETWTPLRFNVGDQVICNMGEKGWVSGKVMGRNISKEDWPEGRVAAYAVATNEMTIFVPADTSQFVRQYVSKKLTVSPENLRFKVGDAVICNLGKQGWMMGKVEELCISNKDWPEGTVVPYSVKAVLGFQISVPRDTDECVRAPDLNNLPPLRFKVGDEVKCNMGPDGWVFGNVRETLVRRPDDQLAMYAVTRHGETSVDKPIYVPMDHDQFVQSGVSELSS